MAKRQVASETTARPNLSTLSTQQFAAYWARKWAKMCSGNNEILGVLAEDLFEISADRERLLQQAAELRRTQSALISELLAVIRQH